ncbi:ShET2/EspL2 family type III secretion system effector toxin [Escherichia coli]|uniref:ShET2/EspL2 family type III secretion system effector toxin n=1 Tax=Escherichia coli TaxID=562 RepID=UPI003EEC798D
MTIYKKIHHPVRALLPVIRLGRHYQSFFTEWKKEKLTHMAAISFDLKLTLSPCRLRIKKTPAGETEYVVSFYDPNATNTASIAIKQTTVTLLNHIADAFMNL